MKKKALIKLLITFLTISLIKTECQKGCLKCSKEDKCLICDQTEFYKKNEKEECEKKILDNCVEMNMDGNCLNCETNYYLDGVKKKCVFLENSKKIENCFSYDPSQNCGLCKSEYFVYAGICRNIEKKIDNCEFYLENGKCTECKEGFLLDFEGKSCEIIEDTKNCLYFSKVDCHTCQPGFVKNKNLYLKNIFKYNSDSDTEKVIDFIKQDNKNFQKRNEICEKTIIENCIEFMTFKTCKICAPNYYLNDLKTCSSFPITVIENCLEYTSNTKCKRCQNKFFLESIYECKPVLEIEKCVSYNGSINTSICILCEGNNFSLGKTCSTRTNDVKNCKELNPSDDNCKVCENGFNLSEDSLVCFSVIANCVNYSNVDNVFSCEKCQDGFFLNNKLCKQGTILNCAIYTAESTPTSQICKSCINKYDLKTGVCVKVSSSINGCDIYQNQQNCLICDKIYFNFLITKKCFTLTPITKCISYQLGSNPLKCDACESTYIPNVEKTICEKMSVSNCKSGPNLSTCDVCEKNYALKNSLCYPILDHMDLNCNESDINNKSSSLITNVLCENCKKDSLPINHKNLFVCVKNENLFLYFNLINDCKKYNYSGSCLECVDGKFLDGNSCLSVCTDKDIKRYDFVSYKTNECKSASDSCEITVKKVDSSGDICVKCKGEYIPVSLGYDNGFFSNFKPYLGEVLIQDSRDIFYGLNCVNLTGKTINSGSATAGLIPNCILYKLRDTTNYDCIRCAELHTGEVENNYIKTCSLDSDFETTKKRGLDVVWEKLFSVSICKDISKIPFIAYIETASDSAVPLKPTSINPSKGQTNPTLLPQKKNIFCNHNTSSFALNESITIPTDCALGAYRLSSTNTYKAFYCAACKPGYKPTLNANNSIIKDQCSLILNCEGKDWFNSCSKCSQGYSFKFDGDIDYTICQSYIKNDHCYASDSNGDCVVCEKGYILNEDKICDRVLSPNCESREDFSIILPGYAGKNFLSYKYFIQQKSRGCHKCKFGYTQVLITTSNYYVCSESEFIIKNSDIILNTSQYIVFCESYFYDGDFKCNKCKEGKLLAINKKKCVPKMGGCTIAAVNDNQCDTCLPDNALINFNCIKGEIKNCSTYYSSVNKEKIICKDCQNEFFKEVNQLSCLKTAVKYCEKPLGLQKCSKCYDGYVLYDDLDFHYCFELDSSLECKDATFKTNLTYGGELTCEKCKEPNQIFITSENDLIINKTVCMKYHEIFKCKKYSDTNLLSTSTFYCLECEEGFYLSSSTGICTKRKLIIEKCIKFSQIDDLCSECDSTSFIDKNGTVCQSYPKGVLGCIGYLSEKECNKCQHDTFLTMNTCKKIENDDKVDNCFYYKSATLCQECKKNYALEDNKCIKSSLSRCLRLKTSKKCDLCEEGYGLDKKDDDNVQCLPLSKTNCISYNPNTPYPCIKCKNGFYSDPDGFCFEADPIINNCLEYKKNDECEKCQINTILSLDRKNCHSTSFFTNYLPLNCLKADEVNKVCTVCKPGFKFVDFECKACTNLTEGCFSCNFDESDCFVCKNGYFMDKNGVCNSNIKKVATVVEENLEKEELLLVKVVLLLIFIL